MAIIKVGFFVDSIEDKKWFTIFLKFTKTKMATTGSCLCGKLTYSYTGEPAKKVGCLLCYSYRPY